MLVVDDGLAGATDTVDIAVNAVTSSPESALTDTDVTLDDGPSGAAYQITGFSGGVLTGFNKQGDTISTTFSADTTYRPANLDKYLPVEPCREAAVAYHTSTDADGIFVSIGSMIGCNARVWINNQTGQVRAFRTVP
jgi:hypothetical protein